MKEQSSKISNHLRGVTLIEMVVIIGILTLALTILTNVFIFTWRHYTLQNNLNKLQLAARTSTYKIAAAARQAESVIEDLAGYQTTNHSVILKLTSLDEEKNLIPNHYDYFIYRANPNDPSTLQEIILADSLSSRKDETKTLTKNLSDLNFVYLDSQGEEIEEDFEETALLKIILILKETAYGHQSQAHFSTQARLRNK